LAVGKYKKTVATRNLLCFWATSELRISQSELGQMKKWCQEMTPKSHLLRVKRIDKNISNSIFVNLFYFWYLSGQSYNYLFGWWTGEKMNLTGKRN